MSKPKVLLVEDEGMIRSIAHDEFLDGGFDPVVAESGDEAIAILSSGAKFDLLFTDIRMPGTADGWAVAKLARKTMPNIAVIYATGYADDTSDMVDGALLFRKPYRFNAVFGGAGQLGILPQ